MSPVAADFASAASAAPPSGATALPAGAELEAAGVPVLLEPLPQPEPTSTAAISSAASVVLRMRPECRRRPEHLLNGLGDVWGTRESGPPSASAGTARSHWV